MEYIDLTFKGSAPIIKHLHVNVNVIPVLYLVEYDYISFLTTFETIEGEVLYSTDRPGVFLQSLYDANQIKK